MTLLISIMIMIGLDMSNWWLVAIIPFWIIHAITILDS